MFKSFHIWTSGLPFLEQRTQGKFTTNKLNSHSPKKKIGGGNQRSVNAHFVPGRTRWQPHTSSHGFSLLFSPKIMNSSYQMCRAFKLKNTFINKWGHTPHLKAKSQIIKYYLFKAFAQFFNCLREIFFIFPWMRNIALPHLTC